MVKNYHGGNRKEAACRYGLKEEDFFDFSANINPLGPSAHVWTALQQALPGIVHYPDPEAGELKSLLASYLEVAEPGVMLGNGGVELIYLLSSFLAPRRIVLTAPTFGEYGQGAAGTETLRINLEPDRGFVLEPEVFAPVLQQGDVVFIGNPNNPTGVVTPKEVILELAAMAAGAGAVLVVDEAFMDFVEESQSVVKLVNRYPNLIVVGSLTKVFALPGLRLGYLVARDELVSRLELSMPPWRINSLAQAAGIASLKDREHLQRSREIIRQERNYLSCRLRELGFIVVSGEANFLLVNSRSTGLTAETLQSFLGPRGVLIRLCHSFYNLDPYYFRVAVRKREENEVLLKLLKEAVYNKQGKEV